MKKERKKPIYGTSAMGNVFIQYRGGGVAYHQNDSCLVRKRSPWHLCGVQSRVSAAATHTTYRECSIDPILWIVTIHWKLAQNGKSPSPHLESHFALPTPPPLPAVPGEIPWILERKKLHQRMHDSLCQIIRCPGQIPWWISAIRDSEMRLYQCDAVNIITEPTNTHPSLPPSLPTLYGKYTSYTLCRGEERKKGRKKKQIPHGDILPGNYGWTRLHMRSGFWNGMDCLGVCLVVGSLCGACLLACLPAFLGEGVVFH